MKSVFDAEDQHKRPDSKIVAALERLSQAFRVLLWEAGQSHGLSPIQIQVLVFILTHDSHLGRIGRLAREFGTSAATMSDVVATLAQKHLIERKPVPNDARATVILLTTDGRRLAKKLADWAEPIRQSLGGLSKGDQLVVMQSLMKSIEELQVAGVVTVARMCTTCRFFGKDIHTNPRSPHHCHLLDKPLSISELRVDCAEWEEAG